MAASAIADEDPEEASGAGTVPASATMSKD